MGKFILIALADEEKCGEGFIEHIKTVGNLMSNEYAKKHKHSAACVVECNDVLFGVEHYEINVDEIDEVMGGMYYGGYKFYVYICESEGNRYRRYTYSKRGRINEENCEIPRYSENVWSTIHVKSFNVKRNLTRFFNCEYSIDFNLN